MSLMNNRNKVGPSTLPYGTPLVTQTEWEWESPSFTLWALACRNSVNQLSKLPVIAYARSFTSSLGWETESNAFLKSK